MKKPFWKTGEFWKTIALMIAVSFFILILTLMSLRIFTRHGQSFIVPDLTGLTMNHLGALEQEYRFRFTVIDSVFDESQHPGTIIRHDPLPGSTVKRGRRFYVTLVASTPDMVRMPNLIDLSLRQATSQLHALGLSVGTVTYRWDMEFQGSVMEQTYRGISINPGESIRRGSYVDLVVSGGPQPEREVQVRRTEPVEERAPEVPVIFEDEF
ncbi:MAG: PASTA domain-containing protein [Bacteroidales bacterium]|nr:PASTA domain-containing protein [Bacteroidales bacterium]